MPTSSVLALSSLSRGLHCSHGQKRSCDQWTVRKANSNAHPFDHSSRKELSMPEAAAAAEAAGKPTHSKADCVRSLACSLRRQAAGGSHIQLGSFVDSHRVLRSFESERASEIHKTQLRQVLAYAKTLSNFHFLIFLSKLHFQLCQHKMLQWSACHPEHYTHVQFLSQPLLPPAGKCMTK